MQARKAEKTRAALAEIAEPRRGRGIVCRIGSPFSENPPDEAAQKKMAAEFEITREKIRQIEAKALRKLKHPTRSEKLKSFNTLD